MLNQTKIRHHLYRMVYITAGAFRKTEKKAVFESFHGKSYSDNPRAISEKLHELYPDYQIIWGFQDPERIEYPDYVKAYSTSSLKYKTERETAFAFIRNEAMSEDLHKRKNQIYIQTWHGDRGIKRILYDAWEGGSRPSKVMDSEITDLFVVGSDYAEKRIKSAFRYLGLTMKTGCPRNDCLVHPGDDQAVRQQLGLPADCRILLYAPTFRKGQKVSGTNVDLEQVLGQLNKKGEKWICLARAHPKALGIRLDQHENIIDASRYPDMSDLMMIADMLITDYSSSAGDFILRMKPVILAQFDRDEYLKNSREFYADCREIGYWVAENQDELNRYIDQMTGESAAENCRRIMEYYGTNETGHSSEDVCRWIDEKYHQMFQ
ncbi:MAG: CDP-glycerol glycerophosphotransferase family protein [Solobacterium sp.]|nr:CDP-glycerol glycerophosphotransferase family protein [Solobacterium sp.]